MKKILAIDDQKDNLVAIKAVLQKLISDCEVHIAQSGEEGLKIAGKEQPDTILLDIIMPKMDGYEVCKKLKEDERTRHIPVIMLTAILSDTKSKIKGLETGADAFFTKPIEPNELSAQINVMFRMKEAENMLREERELLEIKVKARTKELSKVNKELRLEISERKQAEKELAKHQENLEELVRQRTKELEEQNRKLQDFNKLFINREFRIKELRDKLMKLEEELRNNADS